MNVLQGNPPTQRELFERETERIWEEYWKSYNPSLLDQERIARLLDFLEKHVVFKGAEIADLGCGNGLLTNQLEQQKACITAVDISPRALSQLSDSITKKQSCLPYIHLPESHFDGVILADTIAELPTHLHRLLVSEAALLLKRDGWLLASSPLDPKTDNPQGHFFALLMTEFEIQDYRFSFHRLKSKKNRSLMLLLECFSRLIWGAKSPTHTIVIASKRSLL